MTVTLVLAGLGALPWPLLLLVLWRLRGWGRPARPDWRFPIGTPFVCAHRGGSALQPENTLRAFTQAARDPACRFLELDVQLSADGVPVVLHDATLDRTTDRRGPVQRLTAEQLRQVNAAANFPPPDGAPAPFCPVPTLEEVLRALPQCLFSVDVKSPLPEAVPATVLAVRRTGMEARVLLGSGRLRTERRIRRAAPEVPSFFTGLSVLEFWLAVHLGLGRWVRPRHHSLQVPERYGPLRIVTRRLLRHAHRLGIPVTVWTVNDGPAMRRLLRLGVDGVMTDRPDLAARVIREFKR